MFCEIWISIKSNQGPVESCDVKKGFCGLNISNTCQIFYTWHGVPKMLFWRCHWHPVHSEMTALVRKGIWKGTRCWSGFTWLLDGRLVRLCVVCRVLDWDLKTIQKDQLFLMKDILFYTPCGPSCVNYHIFALFPINANCGIYWN